MTYQAKQTQDFSSINYGSVLVSAADNRPPTIHLLLSSLCHFPYMHMYNMDAFRGERRREGREEQRDGQLFSLLFFSLLIVEKDFLPSVKAGKAEDKALRWQICF